MPTAAVKEPDYIQGYRVLKHIGSGAASEIYCVCKPDTGQVFALKHVLLEQSDKDDRFLVQAENEVKVSKKLTHPSIRRILSVEKVRPKGWTRTEVAVLMELVDGQSMDNLTDLGTLAKIRIFREVADALAHMNDKGFVHADMKPTNVLVTEDGAVKVIDLGQAHPIGKSKERIQGTPGYIAPEQAELEPLTERTDVYNFGATMYWMLTQREVPTQSAGGRGGQSATLPPPAHTIVTGVPAELGELINTCVEPNQYARWKNMHTVVRKLDAVIKDLQQKRAG
ncbi:MAG: serine/threonine-protein kinase [Phycisphaerales bacterium]|nr:serine/threonine-protein kinase [Phycisphaerales bacterium]